MAYPKNHRPAVRTAGILLGCLVGVSASWAQLPELYPPPKPSVPNYRTLPSKGLLKLTEGEPTLIKLTPDLLKARYEVSVKGASQDKALEGLAPHILSEDGIRCIVLVNQFGEDLSKGLDEAGVKVDEKHVYENLKGFSVACRSLLDLDAVAKRFDVLHISSIPRADFAASESVDKRTPPDRFDGRLLAWMEHVRETHPVPEEIAD